MGRRIREDYEGVAMATGQMGAVLLRGGDEIPEGVSVDGFLTDDGQPVRAPEDPSPFSGAGSGESFDEAPLREDELHLALAKGADVARHPAYVRGYLDGAIEHGGGLGPGKAEDGEPSQAPEPDAVSDFLNAAYDKLLASGAQHAELWLPDGSLIVYDAASEPPVQAVAAPPTGPPADTDTTPPASAFDPSEHNAHDVITYLGEHEEDRVRVLAAERAGQRRRSVLNRYPGLDPERHPELAQAYDDAAASASTTGTSTTTSTEG